MSLIVSYNVSSCGVCWRVWLLVETGVEWVWSLRGVRSVQCMCSTIIHCTGNCCLLFAGYFSDCVASLELTCVVSERGVRNVCVHVYIQYHYELFSLLIAFSLL